MKITALLICTLVLLASFNHTTASDLSIGQAPYTTPGNHSGLLSNNGHVSAYAFEIFPAPSLLYFYDVSSSSSSKTLYDTTIGTNFFCGGDFVDGDNENMYVIDYDNGDFARVNLASGVVIVIGHPITVSEADKWTGLTIDHNGNAYAVSTDLNRTVLYRIDIQTGEATVIGSTTDASVAIDIAAVGDKLYVVDIRNDALYELSPVDAQATYIGSIGYDTNFAAGLDYDERTQTLYFAAIEQWFENDNQYIQGQLRKIDLETGNATLIDLLPYAGQVDAFAIVDLQAVYLPMVNR